MGWGIRMIDYGKLIEDLKKIESHCKDTKSIAEACIIFNGENLMAKFVFSIPFDELRNPRIYEHAEKELTQPEPKYKIGQKVWFIHYTNAWIFLEGKIESIDNDRYFTYGNWMNESELYPSKEALIQAQLEYWQSLKPKDAATLYAEGAKKIYADAEGKCQHHWKDATDYYDPSKRKCTLCGIIESLVECEHESDGYCYDNNNEIVIGYQLHKYTQQKCKKCGEFYR